MQAFCQRIIITRSFEYFIVALILLGAVILGLETSASIVAEYGTLMEQINQAIIFIFVLEAAVKIYASFPRIDNYFRVGWNVFDFAIIVLALIPATGELAMIARLARLLRVIRLVSTIPELRLIVSTLIRSIPSMGHVVMLMGIIFYIYAVAGFHLFHEHDPEHWRTLGISLLTLFRIVTLEDWTDVMYTGMAMNAYSWIYFVSFVVLGTFVIVNLFIAVVLNNLDEAKQEQLDQIQTVSKKDILKDLRTTQRALAQLQKRLEKGADHAAND